MNLSADSVTAGRHDQLLRLAHKVARHQIPIVGLVPVGKQQLRWQPALDALATALHEVTGTPVALISAWQTWTAPEEPAEEKDHGRRRRVATPALWGRALRDDVVCFSCPPEPGPSSAARTLKNMVATLQPDFSHVLVDMTGFVSEEPAALDAVSACILVGPAGLVTESDLLSRAAALGACPNLGVVLVEPA